MSSRPTRLDQGWSDLDSQEALDAWVDRALTRGLLNRDGGLLRAGGVPVLVDSNVFAANWDLIVDEVDESGFPLTLSGVGDYLDELLKAGLSEFGRRAPELSFHANAWRFFAPLEYAPPAGPAVGGWATDRPDSDGDSEEGRREDGQDQDQGPLEQQPAD